MKNNSLGIHFLDSKSRKTGGKKNQFSGGSLFNHIEVLYLNIGVGNVHK